MPDHIAHQIHDLRAFVITRALVMTIAKCSLDRVRFPTVARQPDYLEPRMVGEPLLNRLRFINPVVVCDEVNLRGGGELAVKRTQQVDDQEAILAFSDDVRDLPRQEVERAGQVAFLIRSWCHDLSLSSTKHPLIADLGQQVNIQLIDKEKYLRRAHMLDNVADAGQFADPLRIVVGSDMARSFPHITQFMQPAADFLLRDRNSTPGFQFGSQGSTTPPGAAPAEGARRTLEDREQRALPQKGYSV